MRRTRARVSTSTAAIIAMVLIVGACYFVFGGTVPFSGSPFVLKALFTTQTEIHISTPVRISGVDVGQVTSVQRFSKSSTAAVVRMSIQPNGLPIHADATMKVRPRIFLEGNYYVDLFPGTPSAPTLRSGQTIPAANTAGPVQLDRVLAALNSDARGNLQTLLQGLGAALDAPPNRAQDARQDPITRGLTGGQALNLSLKYSVGAFRSSAIVNQALLGIRPHDLAGVVKGNQEVFRGLAASPDQLSGLVTSFNATLAALAARQQDLSQTISLLPPLLRSTNSADSALDASFAPTRAFAAEILPGTEQLDATIGAALPWIAQATALVSPSELGGLLSSLTPAVQQTASSLAATKALLSGTEVLARCFIHNVIPTGNTVIQDPPITTGLPVYRELFQSAVGIAGAAGNFDGNGRYVRASAGGGDIRAQTPPVPNIGPFYGNFVVPPLGTRPAFTDQPPPLRRDVPCFESAAPNLNHVTTGIAP